MPLLGQLSGRFGRSSARRRPAPGCPGGNRGRAAGANSPFSESYTSLWHTPLSVQLGSAELAMDLGHWVNDGLMALFFFVIGLEVRREPSIGELTSGAGWSCRSWPVCSGWSCPRWSTSPSTPRARPLGGGHRDRHRHGVPPRCAGPRGPACPTQLRVFLLTLTMIDDIVAVSVIGIAYSDAMRPVC